MRWTAGNKRALVSRGGDGACSWRRAATRAATATPPTDTTGGGTVTTFTGTDFTKNVPVNAPGVTSTEIHVGSITSKTNPLGGDAELERRDQGLLRFRQRQGRHLRPQVEAHERARRQARSTTRPRSRRCSPRTTSTRRSSRPSSSPVRRSCAKAGIPTFGWNINAEWAGPKNFFPNVAPAVLRGLPAAPARPADAGEAVERAQGRGDRLQRPAVGRLRDSAQRRDARSSAPTSTREVVFSDAFAHVRPDRLLRAGLADEAEGRRLPRHVSRLQRRLRDRQGDGPAGDPRQGDLLPPEHVQRRRS